MLRAAAKSTVQRGLQSVRTQATQAPSPASAPKSGGGGFGKALVYTIGAAGVASGGVVGYAYTDPEFRKKLESNIPQAKPVLDRILGDLSKTQQQLTDLKDKAIGALPGLPKKKDDPAQSEPGSLLRLPEAPSRAPVKVDPVDVKKNVIPPPPPAAVSPDAAARLNRELEDRLKGAIASAQGRVHATTEAKAATVRAIQDHAALLKKTVDDGPKADWDAVTKSLQKAEALAKTDAKLEVDAKNYLDTLNKVVLDGKNVATTAKNALLINAQETFNKFNHQIAELNGLVQKARQESQILNQYKELIDKSRQQFAVELQSILPNIDVHAKDKTLTEDELNALIAHAHLRVDQLRRQLTEQQLREEQNIARAIEDQRRADERLARERLGLELRRVEEQKTLDLEKEVLKSRSQWEIELEERLKRAAAAHSEHLEQVIRTQRQLFEIEHSQKLEEAVLLEREQHSRQVGAALSRLSGIESALTSRVALDAENRRSKQYWIACQNLVDSIVHGRKAGNDAESRRQPLGTALDTLAQVTTNDDFAHSLIAAFPSESVKTGTYTEQDLKNRFNTVYKLGRRTATIDENGGTLSRYVTAYIRSLFTVDLPRKFSREDKFDPSIVDNLEVLQRAKWYVDNDDLGSAVKLTQLLRGEPARIASGWVQDARQHLETKLIAELLVAHAAVTSIRSTY